MSSDERARATAEIVVERCDHDGSPQLCDYCAETARLVADAVAQTEHDTWIGKIDHDVTQCSQCATDATAAEGHTDGR